MQLRTDHYHLTFAFLFVIGLWFVFVLAVQAITLGYQSNYWSMNWQRWNFRETCGISFFCLDLEQCRIKQNITTMYLKNNVLILQLQSSRVYLIYLVAVHPPDLSGQFRSCLFVWSVKKLFVCLVSK